MLLTCLDSVNIFDSVKCELIWGNTIILSRNLSYSIIQHLKFKYSDKNSGMKSFGIPKSIEAGNQKELVVQLISPV